MKITRERFEKLADIVNISLSAEANVRRILVDLDIEVEPKKVEVIESLPSGKFQHFHLDNGHCPQMFHYVMRADDKVIAWVHSEPLIKLFAASKDLVEAAAELASVWHEKGNIWDEHFTPLRKALEKAGVKRIAGRERS